ncbi:MAG: GntR family transcriptional regulator [Paracoccaceae bacterium]|nr:GntR family transcriptional regulator [Paracoccaceae bacterium]
MSIALEDATDALRRKVLRGDYMPAAKLREVGVAEDLGVSRTIARLAMSMLEHEGLLSRAPNRGCRVNRFSIEQIVQAIEVRGNLEAMAARQAAERGLSEDVDSAFDDILQRSAQALAMGVQDEGQRQAWINLNTAFHDTLIKASGNWAIRVAVDQMSRLPLVSPAMIIFERKDFAKGNAQLASAHADHLEIVLALRARQSQRAEARVREHAFVSARNKRVNLADPETMALARALPGGALISDR